MHLLFYAAAAVAILATLLMLTRLNAVHALLYLIVSLLAVSVVFFVIGAPFVAALEVIVYAGAIMVLFVFVVMLLNMGRQAMEQESQWLKPGMWVGPIILAAILAGEVAFIAAHAAGPQAGGSVVGPREVGLALYGPYLMGVELASFLLLGALVGAYHLGVRPRQRMAKENGNYTHEPRVAAGGDIVRAGADRPAGTP